ncbi:hypothetical protein CYMTET_39529, partial [Cymbomonas tetramitiformis]
MFPPSPSLNRGPMWRLFFVFILGCISRSHAHTTDVCWIWDADGRGIQFYVATWHDDQYCDIWENGKFCPLTVTQNGRTYDKYEGKQITLDHNTLTNMQCRGYCPQQYYQTSCRWWSCSSYPTNNGDQRLTWFTFHVDINCGEGVYQIVAPNHYMFDSSTDPYHSCKPTQSTYNGATYEGYAYNWG